MGAPIRVGSARGVWEFSRTFLNDADGIVAVFRVFMDESGTHDESPVITVGAAWSRPSIWKKWTKDWNVAKRPIRVHHSTDCHNRFGEYEGWSRPQRDEYVKKILPVIASHGIQGRVAGLHIASYVRLIERRREVAKVFGHPYVASLQWAVTDICEEALRAGHARVAFVHERNDFRELADTAFGFVKARFPQMKLTLSFADKADFVPLQCADVFAFEGNRRLRDTMAKRRKPMDVMDPTGDRIGFIDCDEQEMPEFVETMCRLYDHFCATGRFPHCVLDRMGKPPL